MQRSAYSILSGMCIIGAVLLAALGNPESQFVALLGLAGTLAGRGPRRGE